MEISRCIESFLLPPSIIDLLKKKGFNTQEDVISIGPVQLSKELEIDMQKAVKIIKLLQPPAPTTTTSRNALQILKNERRKNSSIYTLCEALDKLLGGGIKLDQITEICGVPGIGKTQLAIQLCCDCQIPSVFGGVEGEAVYIDTEGSFTSTRAYEIAKSLCDHIKIMNSVTNDPEMMIIANKMSSEELLKHIYVFRCHDYLEQLAIVKSLPRFLNEHNIKIVIFDSVAFAFRRDFSDLSLRTRLITGMTQDLIRIAEEYNTSIVLINQVTAKIGNDNKSTTLVPALGESWGHCCPTRIMLHWGADSTRYAHLFKSSSQVSDSVPYIISSQGVRGIQKKRKLENSDI